MFNNSLKHFSLVQDLDSRKAPVSLYEILSGHTIDEVDDIAASQELSEPLYKFDQNDFHVWVTAIQTRCNYIVTANTRRFPKQIGEIKRIHPRDYFNIVTGVSN